MNKISRYILRFTIAPFLFGTGLVIFLFLMQFFTKQLDKLVGKGLEDIVIIQLIVYSIAGMVIIAVPLGVLFASLMAFGNLSATSEITIIKSSGGSLIRMMVPVFIVAGVVTYFLFLYNNEVVPDANHKAKVLLYDIQRKKPTFAIEEGQFSNEIDGYTILARKKDTTTNILSQVTIYDNRNIQVNRTINAETCEIVFSKDMKKIDFKLHNGEIYQSQNRDVKNYRQIKFDDYVLSVSASGFGFEQSDSGLLSRGDREMRIVDMQQVINEAKKELLKYNHKLQTEIEKHYNYLVSGINDNANELSQTEFLQRHNNIEISSNNTSIRSVPQNYRITQQRNSINDFYFQLQNLTTQMSYQQEKINNYEVEIHKKYAIPFACLVFILIGCPLGVITKGGNFGLSASITLGFYIVYWACLMGGEKLSDRMLIDPFLSMWFGNIVLGVIGILLTIKANNESLNFKKIFKINQKGK